MKMFIPAVLALLIVSMPASAQLCFQETEIISSLFEPKEVVFADVDQDGDVDIISTSSPISSKQPDPALLKLAWYENDGGGVPTFTEHVFGNPASFLNGLRVVDFNGDGLPDIFAQTALGGPDMWYQNTGGLNPTFVQRETGFVGSQQVTLADIDGDGDTDILRDGMFWQRYTGVGSTHFEFVSYTNTFNGVIQYVLDVDNDGDLDITTTSGNWYQNDGGITPQFTERMINEIVSLANVIPVDLNGDSAVDFVSQYFAGLWFRNSGGANPTFGEFLAFDPPIAFITNAVDLDLDGDIDILNADGFWYENNGAIDPVFTEHSVHPSASGPFTVRDLDGDGDLDLVKHGESVWYRNDTIFFGLPPTFVEQTFVGLSPISTPNMFDDRLIDINGDGDLDSFLNRELDGLFTWFDNSTMVSSQTNVRYGDFQAAIDDSSDGAILTGDPGIFECAESIVGSFDGSSYTVKSTGDMYLGQFTDLGIGSFEAAEGFDLYFPDLMITNNDGEKIRKYLTGETIRLNFISSSPASSIGMIGNVVIAPEASYFPYISSPTTGVKQIQSGDLDNDGDIDTIVLRDDGTIAWYAQQSQTPHAPWDGVQQSIPSGVSESFEVGDFNNDGLLDIVGHDEGELFLFLNNGFRNGALEPFTLQTIIAGDFSGGDIVVGDMDNDGDLDMIHGGLVGSGYSARLYTNNGANPPAFSASTIYSSSLPIHHVNLVDLEGDGNLDVLMAVGPPFQDFCGIVVLANQGTGPATFSSSEQGFFPQGAPRKVYGGDFDGDGDSDILAILSGTTERLMLLENQHPSPEFRRRVIDQQEDYGADLAVGDYDSDGDLDLISGTLMHYDNTGSSPVFFRKDDQYADENPGAIHPIDYQQNGALDIVRSDMRWSMNLDFTSLLTYGSFDITGDLDLFRSNLYLPDTSMGSTFFNVSGVMNIHQRATVFASVNTFEISNLVNTGSLTFTNFTQEGGGVMEIIGNYAQYDVTPSGETTGTLRLDLHPNGAPQFTVQGAAALAGSLIVNEFNSSSPPISGEDPLGIAVQASSFVPGRDRFDVYSGPVLSLEYSDGSIAQGTVIPMYNQTEGPTSTVTLVPITLEELLFTQNPFSSEGIPNDAVLFDVTGAIDGSPDGNVDLIVAIPEIPGVSPNGAVAVFQGSLTANGFQMVSASLYTGVIVDSPGSVEVGYFDNDSIPDIAFANQGTNGNNNDVHFLHMDSSNPSPLSIAPLPAFNIASGFTVSDLASDDFISFGDGMDDLLLGIQSNGTGGGVVQTIAFGGGWESCEVDVDDVDTVASGYNSVAARGIALANVVVTSPDSNTVTYFVNIGDFENMVPIVIPTGTHPTEVLAEDLDGDGEPEIVVICRGNSGSHGVVTVSRNIGGNAFAPPVNLPLGSNAMINPKPVSLALSDVDDDGDRDMVLVSVNDSGDQTVRVIRNTTVPGNGLSFAAVIDAPNQPAGLPLIVRSADLDGDSPTVADDIVVLVDPASSFTREGVLHRVGDDGGLNSIDLSGDFCAADLTRDGSLNFLDVSAFLAAFSSQNAAADFNSDGSFNFIDVSAFLAQFMNNCGS
tara:strand:+ start:265669 stop:270354 length:4686 start_codon:yes stop_codon:yes gene_type:complete